MQELEDKVGFLCIQGQTLLLHPHKAIYWKEKSRLLLADVHLGKAGHFRQAGIPVPQTVAMETLNRLQELLEAFCPQEVWILGDLFHSRYNKEWDLWADFVRMNDQQRFVLIPGNHDRYLGSGDYPFEILEKEYKDPPFIFSHEPLIAHTQPYINMVGHIHPAILLRGKGRQSLRLPCFWIQEQVMVLPAFGAFTGMHTIEPKDKDKIFAVGEGKIWKIHG
ncbi:MAG: ligase-associated DNA damage response endonuclease PdeM [Bacteroidota bacterium]